MPESVSVSITRRDCSPLDVLVLRDLVRFGVLADYQVARRYADSAFAAIRLQTFVDGGVVSAWPRMIQDTALFSPTPLAGRLADCGLRATRPLPGHLRHDVALVDLAAYLVEHEPGAEFHTEREVRRALYSAPHARRGPVPPSSGHRPDGLLRTNGKLLAIELEHSIKTEAQYASICRWFAITDRIDAVCWYSDSQRIIARIRKVHREHGFVQDVDFTFEPFPNTVIFRPWVTPSRQPAKS